MVKPPVHPLPAQKRSLLRKKQRLAKLFFVLIQALLFTSCQTSSEEAQNSTEPTSDRSSQTDTTVIDSTNTVSTMGDPLAGDTAKISALIDVKNWSMDDFIPNKKDRKSESLRRLIKNEKEAWSQVESPFVATYLGCDFGDYFHLNFEDGNGTIYDFGFGDNALDEYPLYDETDFEDNPKYLGKTFNVYWNWKIATFPCCDGEYDLVEAYLPGITKLELTGASKQ